MNIDISTPEQKQEVLDLFRSFSYKKDIFEHYNVSNNTQNGQYINYIANQIGFDFSYYKEKKENKKYCLYCGLEITGKDKSRKKFCNSSCAASYNNMQRNPMSNETKKKISNTLKKDIIVNETHKKNISKKALHLKDRLYRDGVKERKCEICGITEWQGKEINFQLHHINGNHSDNRIENLQILCPNCHSQTDNYCHLNREVQYKPFLCSKCGKELYHTNKSGLCADCYNEYISYNKMPDKEELSKQYEIYSSYSSLARYYKVSNRTIKKWLKRYGLE